MFYFLGVDGGGSKIDVALKSEAGQLLLTQVEGGNIEIVGEKKVWQLIIKAISQMTQQQIQLRAACFSLCGVDFPQDENKVQNSFAKFLQKDFNFKGPFQVENDAFCALRAGQQQMPAYLLSLGTGFTAGAIKTPHEKHLICDYQIRNLLNMAMASLANACMGLYPKSKIVEKTAALLNYSSNELLPRICHTEFRNYVTALTQEEKYKILKLYFKLYQCQDPAAVELLDDYSLRMARALKLLKKQCNQQSGPVVFSGSFFARYPKETLFFRQQVMKRASFNSRMTVLQKPPVLGALLAAENLYHEAI